MAKKFDKSSIVSLGVITPGHVSQSVDAFTGIEAYDVSLSGSLNITGSIIIDGPNTSISASRRILADQFIGNSVDTPAIENSQGNVITITDSLNLPGGNIHITSSGNISSSGDLIISSSENPGQAYNVLVKDPTTGKIFHTGSYSAGSGGGASSTNFTQSLFVTPSGNDGTAVVGDMLKPFQTILAATASASPGDTIMVYPGFYTASCQILKEGVKYYFFPGSHISASDSVPLMEGVFNNIDVRGYGIFEGGGTFDINDAFINLTISSSGYLEFDKIKTTSLKQNYNATVQVGTSENILNKYFELKGRIESTGSSVGSYHASLNVKSGNVKFDGSIHMDQSNAGHMGIRLATDANDALIKADVYTSKGICVDSTARNAHSKFEGRYETGDKSTYYVMRFNDGYQGQHIIDAEIVGALHFHPGSNQYGGVHFSGYQVCTDSPSGNGAIYIQSGLNYIDASIYSTEAVIFGVNGGNTHFGGVVEQYSNAAGKIFNVADGTFTWNGASQNNDRRADSSVINGGTLIIDSYLEHHGGNSPNNEFAFNLSGGTLEINNKVVYHQQTTGSGIVNMTGGYLKLNGAQLIQDNGTGSFAHCIKLNGSSHSGSILNNSFTNLRPFGPGSFTNEIVGGGTLFESDKLY